MILFAADFIEKGEEEELVLLLYDKYNRLIYKKIRDKTGAQRGVVEDLVNDTFIRLIAKIETLKTLGERELLYYIARTSDHVAIDYIR